MSTNEQTAPHACPDDCTERPGEHGGPAILFMDEDGECQGFRYPDCDEEKKALALATHLDCDFDEVQNTYGEDTFEAESESWLVVDDDRGDELWDEHLENYLDDCVLPDLPEAMRGYFDKEAWKADAQVDGRAHYLSGHDGNEYEQGRFFLYRTN